MHRLVLRIALAQAPRGLRLHQLGAEIEGVGAIVLDIQAGKKRERVLRDRVPLAVEDMDAVFSGHDPEIGVAHLACESLDILDRGRERLAVVDLQQPG